MSIRDELIASRASGGPGIMLITTETGIAYVGLSPTDQVVTLDPTVVTYGGELGLRYLEAPELPGLLS